LRDAERDHRRHAVVEQVIADVKNSAFAHAPSGHFQANAAWLALAALAHNLTRAASAGHKALLRFRKNYPQASSRWIRA
jgi:hypothetical protein